MRAAGLEPDKREPLPHITFARPRKRGALRLAEGGIMPRPCAIQMNPLAVYGWADDRNARQFKILHELA